MAQTAARAQLEGWSPTVIAEKLLNDVRPRYSETTRELRCLAGLCGVGGDTWG
jgi:hypothetical protein